MSENPVSTVEIICQSKDKAVELARLIIKSGLLKNDEQIRVNASVWIID
jgi:hypothetical protein